MLLVHLKQPYLAQEQFQTPLGLQVAPGGGVVVIRILSDQILTAGFYASVVIKLQLVWC